MLTIPIQPTPAQSVKVILGGQNCVITLTQKPQGLFFDLNSNGVDVVTSVIARDAVQLVCREYVGFIGNLLFVDTRGNQDPTSTGLGNRFVLLYLTADEYALV